MTIYESSQEKYRFGLFWRCPQSLCSGKKDLLSDGLLDSVGISPKMFYLLVHMFSFNIKADIAEFVLRRLIRDTISIRSIDRYYYSFRRMISVFLSRHFPILTLPGPIEIDETFIGRKRNHNYLHGRRPARHIPVFGIHCRTTGRTIIHVANSKEKISLLPFLFDHVQEGALIYSDKASMYVSRNNHSHIEALDMDYSHFWVNHTYEFVNQFFGDIHINNLERKWRSFKKYISHTKRGGMSPEILQTYIDTFLLSSNCNTDSLYDIILHILSFLSNN